MVSNAVVQSGWLSTSKSKLKKWRESLTCPSNCTTEIAERQHTAVPQHLQLESRPCHSCIAPPLEDPMSLQRAQVWPSIPKAPKPPLNQKIKGLKIWQPPNSIEQWTVTRGKIMGQFFSRIHIYPYCFFLMETHTIHAWYIYLYFTLFYHQKQPKCRHITMVNIPVPCIRHGIEMQRIASAKSKVKLWNLPASHPGSAGTDTVRNLAPAELDALVDKGSQGRRRHAPGRWR